MVNVDNKTTIEMGWKSLIFISDNDKIIFVIEPMIDEPDIIYIPEPAQWNNSTSRISEKRNEILSIINSIEWNRDFIFKECNSTLMVLSVNEDRFETGTLEATKGAKELLQLSLFDPCKTVEKEHAHELWCVLEKKFAEDIKGKVTISANNIIENSVFNKITIPTLLENDNVIMHIVGR